MFVPLQWLLASSLFVCVWMCVVFNIYVTFSFIQCLEARLLVGFSPHCYQWRFSLAHCVGPLVPKVSSLYTTACLVKLIKICFGPWLCSLLCIACIVIFINVNELLYIEYPRHILHSSTTFFLCQYYKCISFKFLGCCCHPDMQVLVLVTAAIVNTLSPICVQL